MLAALGLPLGADAAATIFLGWDATTNPGSGLGVGTDTIQAAPGDQLVLGIYLTAGPEGTSNYVVSVEFDNDLLDELDLVSTTELAPSPMINFTQGVASTRESSGGQGGRVYSFEASTIFTGPAATTVELGTITFHVNPAVASDGVDVEVGLFSVLVDGIYSNGNADLGPTATFLGARVDTIGGGAPGIPALPLWAVWLAAAVIVWAGIARWRRAPLARR